MLSAKKSLAKKISRIVSAIDLNYIVAEAQVERYQIKLILGEIRKNKICWTKNEQVLPSTYKTSLKTLAKFVVKNQNRVIRINTKSLDDNYITLDRNAIIYTPPTLDLTRTIKSQYAVVSI